MQGLAHAEAPVLCCRGESSSGQVGIFRVSAKHSYNLFILEKENSISKVEYRFEEDTGVRSVKSYNLQEDHSNRDSRKKEENYTGKEKDCSINLG